MLFGEKPLEDHVVQEGEHWIVVARYVEQTAWLAVLAELRPGSDLEELLQGARASAPSS